MAEIEKILREEELILINQTLSTPKYHRISYLTGWLATFIISFLFGWSVIYIILHFLTKFW